MKTALAWLRPRTPHGWAAFVVYVGITLFFVGVTVWDTFTFDGIGASFAAAPSIAWTMPTSFLTAPAGGAVGYAAAPALAHLPTAVADGIATALMLLTYITAIGTSCAVNVVAVTACARALGRRLQRIRRAPGTPAPVREDTP